MKRSTPRTPKASRSKGASARTRAAASEAKVGRVPSKRGSARGTTTVSKKGARKSAVTAAGRGVTSRGKAARPKRRVPAKLVADREHVHRLLKGFSTVMLITLEGEGEGATLSARPMNIAGLGDDCTITFVTNLQTTKVGEVERAPQGHVVAQSRTTFLSLRGRTEVVRDRDRIDQAWKPAYKIFFPEGKDDPRICLVVFHPEEAELWDRSGARGLKFLFNAARSMITGEPVALDPEQHARVDLRPE